MHAQTVADVTQEQLEADDDVSLQQRVFMATATTAEGASEIVDNEIAAGRYSMLDMLCRSHSFALHAHLIVPEPSLLHVCTV